MILTVTLNPAIDKVYFVDSFMIGDVFRPQDMWATAGGKGLNVSRVASILGEDVVATGFLGGGNGQFIRNQLKGQGIKDAFVEINGDTRICVAINDPIDNTSTEILEAGPNLELKEQREFLDRFKTIALQADIVTISGSLPKGLPIGFYGQLIDMCKELGKRTLLDASGKTLIESIKHNPFMITPNRSELEFIMGKELKSEYEIIQSARELRDSGIDVVVVTLGEAGSIAATESGIFRVKAPPIKTISAVGSGDSFLAGCAVALSKGKPIEQALKKGTACGMANTQFSETGQVCLELVDKFYSMVSVEKVLT